MAPVFPPLFRPLPVPSPLDFRVSFLCGSVLHVFGFSWIIGQSRYSILGFQVIILPLFISLSSFSLFRHVRSGRMRTIDIHCSNMAYNTCPINSPKSLWSLCWIQSQYCTGGVYWVLSIKEIKSYFHQLIGVHVIWGICSESLIFADKSCAGRGGRVVKAMDC